MTRSVTQKPPCGDAPIPDGPSPETVEPDLGGSGGENQFRRHPISRRKTHDDSRSRLPPRCWSPRAELVYFALAPPAKATAAFAEMAQKLSKAHTLAYRTTTEGPDLKTPLKGRCFFKEPNLMRTEIDGGAVVMIGRQPGQAAHPRPGRQVGAAARRQGLAAAPAAGRRRDDRLPAAAHRGRRQARGRQDDRQHPGAGLPGQEAWHGDDDLGRPGNAAASANREPADRVQDKEIRSAITDFQIDPQIDDALFRVEPPAGYALRKEESKTIGMDEKTFLNPENAAADLLRIFAEKTGGTFPKRLDDPAEFQKIMPKKPAKRRDPGLRDVPDHSSRHPVHDGHTVAQGRVRLQVRRGQAR